MTGNAAEQAAQAGLQTQMHALGDAAVAAGRGLATASAQAKETALLRAAESLRQNTDTLTAANQRDLETGRARGLSEAQLDRLELTDKRIEAMASGLETIAALPDPVGATLAQWRVPSGLEIARVSTPIGVIGIIYESRPNVTADAAGLCIKAGNAAVLRGGSESYHSAGAILDCLHEGLAAAGLPEAAVQRVPTTDREAVGILLTMDSHVDLIVPRGGRGLVERVKAESRMPVLAHLEGVNHSYVQASADPGMVRSVIHNAKMRRPGICGATETVLIDRDALESHLPGILDDLAAAGCELRGDATIQAADSRVAAAIEADWDTEYLAPIVSLKAVDSLDAAVAHVNAHGSGHTEAILTGDESAADTFCQRVDAAIVMVNASTQFADGGEFGMGAEIGIATDRTVPRGPIGAVELTSYKSVVRGTGQTRP